MTDINPTLQGLADFALVQSYLSTAGKWGVSKLGALRGLFNGQAWIPLAPNPPDNAVRRSCHMPDPGGARSRDSRLSWSLVSAQFAG